MLPLFAAFVFVLFAAIVTVVFDSTASSLSSCSPIEIELHPEEQCWLYGLAYIMMPTKIMTNMVISNCIRALLYINFK